MSEVGSSTVARLDNVAKQAVEKQHSSTVIWFATLQNDKLEIEQYK